MNKQNILLFSRSTVHGGTENIIVQLAKIFNLHANKIILCCANGFRINMLENTCTKFYEIPDISSKSPRNILLIITTLNQIVKEENITIIHTHHRMAAFYVRLLKLDKKCKFINTSHNTFFDKRYLTKYAYKNCHLIACGDMVKKNLEKIYNLHNITVIHNVVDDFDNNIKPNALLSELKDNGNILIGNIGRLSKQKGMKYFIEAAPIVLAKYPNVKFLIIGNGELEKTLKKLVRNKGLLDSIYFMGYRTDIQNLMTQMDFLVLSSLWEGFPLTPIEAFSVGKTIIATAVDGTVEIIENEINGFLVKKKDPSQLAEKIIYLIENTEKRKQMEIAALRCYQERFSFDIFANKYLKYYESIISK